MLEQATIESGPKTVSAQAEFGAKEIEPSRCPLCGAPNQCRRCIEGPTAMTCWCHEFYIPPAILAQVPPEAKNKACVCRDCLLRLGAILMSGS